MEAKREVVKTEKSEHLRYLVPGIVFALLSAFVVYRAGLVLSPLLAKVSLVYFIAVFIILLIVETLLIMFAARLAKVTSRSWQKALLIASGVNFINGVMSLSTASLVSLYKGYAAALSLSSMILIWFFVRRVYGLNHKQVFRFIRWSLLVISVLAFITGLISTFFLGRALR